MLPGVAHHVTQWGNNRQDVFFVDDDRCVYLSYLQESAERHGLAVSAYCLMTNHIHLVATPEREESLSRALGRTHLMYAQYVHRLHGRSGHFWQNRFYSCPLDESHARNAAAYVELNPVRAGMAARPWDYPWSSAAAHCAPLVTVGKSLTGIKTKASSQGKGGDPSGLLALSAWFEGMPVKEWKATLKAIAQSDSTIEVLRIHTRTGRPLGSDVFLSKVEALVGRRVRPLPVGRQKGWRKKKARPRKGGEDGK